MKPPECRNIRCWRFVPYLLQGSFNLSNKENAVAQDKPNSGEGAGNSTQAEELPPIQIMIIPVHRVPAELLRDLESSHDGRGCGGSRR